ncbi:MAG: hypothetical protein R3B09_27805 [Nannocystaceae bacterium]
MRFTASRSTDRRSHLRRALVLCASLFGLGLAAGACDSKSLGEETCKPGETKEVDCNTCSCEGGQWACTEKACAYDPCQAKSCGETCTICDPDDPQCVEDQVLKVCDLEGQCVAETPQVCMGDQCLPGDTKTEGCTYCSCVGGYWSCVELDCYDPCAGKSCGDVCSPCDPNDPDCAQDDLYRACDAQGQCSVGEPVCEPVCMDGDMKKVDCNTCTCEGGQWGCTEIACYDPCVGKACGDQCQLCDPMDPDCTEDDSIKACDPEGICVTETPTICEGAYVPCEGKVCGDECTICAPDDLDCAEDAVLKWCNLEGECSPTPDVCM